MSAREALAWLENNRERVLSGWQATLASQGAVREAVAGALGQLYALLVSAIAEGCPPAAEGVADWIESVSGDAHDRAPFQALTALRRTVDEMLAAESDGGTISGVSMALNPRLDQVMLALTEKRLEAAIHTATAPAAGIAHLRQKWRQASEAAERVQSRLHALYLASQALNASLDEEKTFVTLVEKLAEMLEAEHCALWLSDVGFLRVVSASGSAIVPDMAISLSEENPLNVVFVSGEPQVLERGAADTPGGQMLMDQLGMSTLLLLPLTVQEIPIGVVSLGRAQTQSVFDDAEISLVEAIVHQAATAIQNAGLYQEIQLLNRSLEERVASRTRELAKEKERIETLYAIGRELGTSLDLITVLDKTLRLVSGAVGAQHGSIMLLDRETDTLIYRARLGGRSPIPPEGKKTRFKPGVGVAGWVVQHREPVLIPDVLQDERWVTFPDKAPLTRSLIAAPLIVGDDIHGVLLIADARPNAFDEAQFRLVVASALQVAQTISNVQLYNYVVESAERLGQLLRAEQEERSKSQAILHSIADGVIVSDTRQQVIVCNPAAEEILQTSEHDVIGSDVRRLFDAFAEDGRSDALAALERLTTASNVAPGQVIETTLASTTRIISAHMAPVLIETGESLGVVTALRDITREVEADRAKSEFVSTVSHELRTPLTSIKGYADLLFARAVGPVNEQQERFLAIIKNNADRLTALINDLLDISRIETGRVRLKIELVDLTDVIKEVVESLREQIESKGLQLFVDLCDDPPQILGDRARLIQIVTNLVSNAFKYTDEGWIRVSFASLDEAVRLDVADSGIGIATKDQGRIFERFYRADTPVMEGTGLGLAITKQLVELHGGRVWVKSEVGAGSTFTVILPVVAKELPQSLLSELPTGAKKILVVDDERDIVALLRHHLSSEGYQVVTAATGDQAIEKALRERPDLITLDVLLPDRHGFEVLQELKSRPETAHIPVIILSVVQDEDSGYQLGAVDYIVKPIDEDKLLRSVARTFRQKGKVLIAEDTPDTARMLAGLLKQNGYETLIATNGYETLSLARRERPGLILLDLRMPGMDGYEALTRLKKDPETRNIPILVVSAHAADLVQERLRLQEMGAEDLLTKPFSLAELMAVVRQTTLGESGQDRGHDGHAAS